MRRGDAGGSTLLLPQAAEYALRAIVCLVRAGPERLVTRDELVAQAHLPPAYAAKVLRKLVLAGLVESLKGWHGGFRLTRPAATIRVIDVLVALDAEPSGTRCAFGWPACDATRPCALHDAFQDLQLRFLAWARSTTLDGADDPALWLRDGTAAR